MVNGEYSMRAEGLKQKGENGTHENRVDWPIYTAKSFPKRDMVQTEARIASACYMEQRASIVEAAALVALTNNAWVICVSSARELWGMVRGGAC
jgi:hypothetical protein